MLVSSLNPEPEPPYTQSVERDPRLVRGCVGNWAARLLGKGSQASTRSF